ncbi:MAG: hypothetical protein ACXVZL_12270 [Gaiellaceae bacterium]
MVCVDWFVRGITSQPNGENGFAKVEAHAFGCAIPSSAFCQQPSLWGVAE